MRHLLSSPRRRRRLYWGCGFLVAAGCALAIGLLWPNTRHEEDVFRAGKPQITHQEPKRAKLPKSDLVAAQQALDRFVLSAVLRQHLERSFGLTTPQMRDRMTLQEWKTGNIPVPWFPAKDFAFAKSRLRYSYANFARYEVLIWARPKAQTASTSFSSELRAVGRGPARHWVVDYFEPLGGGIMTPPTRPRNPLAVAQEPRGGSAPLGIAWVLLPLSVLSMIVLIPAGLMTRGWLRNRRVEREYAKTLPPLRRPEG